MERLSLHNVEELRSIATVLPDSYKVVIGYKDSLYGIFGVEQDVNVETGRETLYIQSWDGSLQMGVRTFVGHLYTKRGGDSLMALPAEDINPNLSEQLTKKQPILAAEIDIEAEMLVLWTGDQKNAEEEDNYLRVNCKDASKLLSYMDKGDMLRFLLPGAHETDVFGIYVKKLFWEPYGSFIAGRIGGGNVYVREAQCAYDVSCYLTSYITDMGYDKGCVLRLEVTPELLQARVKQILDEGNLLIE